MGLFPCSSSFRSGKESKYAGTYVYKLEFAQLFLDSVSYLIYNNMRCESNTTYPRA